MELPLIGGVAVRADHRLSGREPQKSPQVGHWELAEGYWELAEGCRAKSALSPFVSPRLCLGTLQAIRQGGDDPLAYPLPALVGGSRQNSDWPSQARQARSVLKHDLPDGRDDLLCIARTETVWVQKRSVGRPFVLG